VVDFGIDRVTSHDYLIHLGTNSFAVLMNRQKFDSLPKAAQDVLTKYAPGKLNQIYVDNLSAYNDELIKQFKADNKRSVVTPSEADLKVIKAVGEKVTADWVSKSPQNAELLTKAKAILAQIRASTK